MIFFLIWLLPIEPFLWSCLQAEGGAPTFYNSVYCWKLALYASEAIVGWPYSQARGVTIPKQMTAVSYSTLQTNIK